MTQDVIDKIIKWLDSSNYFLTVGCYKLTEKNVTMPALKEDGQEYQAALLIEDTNRKIKAYVTQIAIDDGLTKGKPDLIAESLIQIATFLSSAKGDFSVWGDEKRQNGIRIKYFRHDN
ncbi:hypothetical protein BGC07_16300 [Piscirickettsia litoralis]|uniref:Uncharacterized protein n=2 Tax=Piscirickettsia litoralis TaxID=1891921 RepID=A0ABX3A0X5_9GAMM|nr:hypothetical protein BGC07_16300 [Piscirickettsia litoralis]